MAEYIEREAVNALIEAECSPKVAAFLNHAIDNIHAADVRPVVWGRWAETEMSGWDGDTAWVCSACGEPWSLIDGTPADNNMNFCPNCGADMREES